MSMIMMPALLGKAQFIRYFFGGIFWLFFAQFALGYYYFVPLLNLLSYCGVAHSIYVEWQTMFYNFVGSFIFSTMLGGIIMIIVDRPILNLFSVKDYAKLAQNEFDITQHGELGADFSKNFNNEDKVKTRESL